MLFNALTLIVAGLGLVSANPQAPGVNRPGDNVRLVNVVYGGTGCPGGSVGRQISTAGDLITLIFDSYIVETGPGIVISKSRAACQLNLRMRFPQGYQFGVFQADYRGFASLGNSTIGFAKATYYFSGDTKQLTRTVRFIGPTADDYIKSDSFGVSSTIWSPCGREGMLNIKTSLEIRPLGSITPSLMTVDSADLKYTQQYHIRWRRC